MPISYTRLCLALIVPVVIMLGADQIASPRPVRTVGGEVEHPLKLTTADLASLPRQTIKVKDSKGKEATFEGVAIFEILKKAGARVGDKLRGGAMVDYLVVEASDGYRAVFALPELDPAFTDRLILIADTRDGKPMTAPEGPIRVVVPGEKKHARWVRQVTTLTLRRASTVPEPSPSAK